VAVPTSACVDTSWGIFSSEIFFTKGRQHPKKPTLNKQGYTMQDIMIYDILMHFRT
jgi:hypothetical protein